MIALVIKNQKLKLIKITKEMKNIILSKYSRFDHWNIFFNTKLQNKMYFFNIFILWIIYVACSIRYSRTEKSLLKIGTTILSKIKIFVGTFKV